MQIKTFLPFTWVLSVYCLLETLVNVRSPDAFDTGKSFSEGLILASINPQYDKRLFIDLQVQYMKITRSEHVVYINCSECQNKKQFVYTTCSAIVVFMY